jgi:hypothetical protein
VIPRSMPRGLLVAGDIFPGSERIIRDPEAWWHEGERGTRPRARTRDLVGGHWTGGECGTGDPDGTEGPLDQYDDDGPRCVRGMKARKREDGSPMEVGIDFIIGACDPKAEWANCWQTADIGAYATVHMGRGEINARCPAAEIVNAGMPGKFDLRHRPRITRRVHGRLVEQLEYYPGQLRTWVWLCELLASLNGRAGISIARRVPAAIGAKMSLDQLRKHSGEIEHLHCPPHKKVDGGTQLSQSLIDAGWSRGSLSDAV